MPGGGYYGTGFVLDVGAAVSPVETYFAAAAEVGGGGPRGW